MAEKFIRICPICNSPDVSPDMSVPAAVAYGALYNYRCNRCGFVGIAFPEISMENLPEIKETDSIKRDYPLVDISYGKGYLSILKYLSFFGILLYFIIFSGHPSVYSFTGVVIFSVITVFLLAGKREIRSSSVKIIAIVVFMLYAMLFKIL